ncbi:MAG: anti-sigma factor [Bryobacteraceae bacterium]
MTCDELRDSYELYALGVLEGPERGEIREHLSRECPTCTPGVRNARQLVAMLGAAAPATEPPARLRKRVLAVAGEPPRRVWAWSPVWGTVAAVAVLAAIILGVREREAAAGLGRIRAAASAQAGELARLQSGAARQAQELARLNEAIAILNAPDAKQVVFGGAAPQPPRGRVFVDAKRGVLLVASNLPPAPAGKTYEMWVIPKGGKPIPAGLFQSAADGTALHLLAGPVSMAGTAAVAVTQEASGGVPQPTTQPIIVAAL